MSSALIASLSPAVTDNYQAVIGLEVHVQLGTRTKIFCGCPTTFGAPPNQNVCPVCLGLPGALPVVNGRAVELAIRAALALQCSVNSCSRFARKNYFYPDLPKGYQISQYDQPLARNGRLEIDLAAGTKTVGITRVHMEDDAGKSIHDGFRDSSQFTYVDLNRSGAPLIEIVSEPEMHSSEEAHAYLTAIKLIMQYTGVSECDMEKGQLRCDANVSVRPAGQQRFGAKAEIKNLNSFRYAKMALDYEIARQVAILESGGEVLQETRLFNVRTGETAAMRSKEDAHDYRYFPEPDLPPLNLGEAWLNHIREELPELPRARRNRFINTWSLREYDAQVLVAAPAVSDYFERAVAVSRDGRATANWVITELTGALQSRDIADSPISLESLGELIALVAQGELSGKLAKEVFARMFESGDSARAVMDRFGLQQIRDSGTLEKMVDEVIASNPKQVGQYKSGKITVLGFLMGQVMKLSQGQANPATVNELLRQRLSNP